MPTVNVNGVKLYWEVRGEGPPLVFVNGLSVDVADFDAVTTALAAKHKVLVFDNRGAGHSDKPDEPYSIEQMAEDTVAVMRAAGFDRAAVLGVSMGGRIALQLTLAHPDMVERLVLVSTAARTVPSLRRKLLTVLPRLPIFRGRYPQPYYAFTRQRVASGAYNCTGRLSEIRVPTLIMRGRRDRLVSEPLTRELQAGIAGSKVQLFNGGHLFMLFRGRQAFVAAVDEFLK